MVAGVFEHIQVDREVVRPTDITINKQRRALRHLLETYTNVAEFSSPQEWYEAMGEYLDDLCLLHHHEPPDMDAAIARWRS